MSLPEDIASLSREKLLALVAEQQRQIAWLRAQLEEATTVVEKLRAEVTELQRSSKRQATPFSKGNRAQQPKRPGRRPGEGTFSFRQEPSPEEITDPPVDVPVALEACPGCGGRLTEERVDFAYLTELPPMPRPKMVLLQIMVWSGNVRDHLS
jgi:hypothetical protein